MDTTEAAPAPTPGRTPVRPCPASGLRRVLGACGHGPALFLILAALLLAGYIAWTHAADWQQFRTARHELMQSSANGAAAQLGTKLDGLRTTLALFTRAHEADLRSLRHHPQNATIHGRLRNRVMDRFPDAYAVTATDAEGRLLFDDLGQRVGPACRADLQDFALAGGTYAPHLHPQPGQYHFDIMVPWYDRWSPASSREPAGVFFVSFKPRVAARILRTHSQQGFELYLTSRDRPGLVEITENGSRRGLGGDPFLDGPGAVGADPVTPVADSHWRVRARADPAFVDRQRREVVFRAGSRIAAILLGTAIAVILLTLLRRRRRAAEERLQTLATAMEQAHDAVGITDAEGRIEYVNRGFEALTGYSAEEAVGSTFALVRSGQQDEAFYARLWATIRSGQPFQDVVINRRRDGSTYYEEKTITPLRDARGRITRYVSTGKDITEQMEARQRLQYLAQHDALTGLPNRSLFQDRLDQALQRADRSGLPVAVLFLDLDNFKTINDSLGHATGDELLRAIARRLPEALRESDTVARLGGDEFAIILERLESGEAAGQVAENLQARFRAPFEIQGRSLHATTSIGISLYPADGSDGETLCRNADAAMYRAKDAGRNSFGFFTEELTTRAARRMAVEDHLFGARERGELTLHYQPKVDLAGDRTIGVEALLRWQSPELGAVSPGEFIPILEDSGLLEQVGGWVLEESARFAGELADRGLPLRVAINLSAQQLLDPGLPDRVRELLAATHGTLDIEVEITETSLIRNLRPASAVIEELGTLGVHVSIDDFGTGYSSLAYLKRLPIDTLKIDRTFVRDLESDPDDRVITTSIISLADTLGLHTIAEGVETPEQARWLREQGCEQAQGFLYGRPMPADELLTWLKSRGAG